VTDDEKPEEAPKEPPPAPSTILKGLALGLLMIPTGGLLFWIAGNTVLYGWLEIVPKMSYSEACGVMALAWLVRIFMYR
jgi:hypothetical protein